ncbi:TPA: phage exclusion protein Lit family protein [Photobacterium damselae]
MTENIMIKRMVLASAPERKEELNNLWDEYAPEFNLREDKDGFSLSVIFGTVVFDHKSLCKMWLLGFAAQKAFQAYSPLIILSNWMNAPISTNSLHDVEQTKQLNEFSGIIDNILELKSLSDINDFSWPENIPHPDQGKPADVNGAMVFDLICMSGAYCFLHEIQHIRFGIDGTDLDVHQEELACDKFARDMLLNKVNEYSASSGYDEKAVCTKRAMSIALASFLLFAITPKASWGATDTHPRIKDRIDELTNSIDIDDNDNFWIYFGCLAMSIAYYNKVSINPMVATNMKNYTLSIIDALDSSI